MADQPTQQRGRFDRAFLAQLTQRIDGPSFLNRFVKVERSGDRFRALCPFHNDSKPSMYIRDDGSFYCFGCQKKGSVFNFLMELNGLRFTEAVQEVAQFLSVPLPARGSDRGQSEEHIALLKVLEQSAQFFQTQLERAADDSPIKQYLAQRELDHPVINKFQIGFAPDAWDSLKSQFSDAETPRLIAGDVLIKNVERETVYDRFRNRLMFPIRNRQGNVVGFGARALSEDVEPKYLNTKQTAVFSKSRELYGLFEALQVQRRPERLLLVEGYMDVVALTQHDMPYAVAALGTASNAEHFKTMFWFTNEVVCCFDGDDAGRTAASRALEAALGALSEEKSVKFIFLPDGEDPDSFVRTHGKDAFEDLINNAQHVAEYFVDTVLTSGERAFATIEDKVKFIEHTKRLVRSIQHESYRAVLARQVADCFPDDLDLEQLLTLSPPSSEPPPPPPPIPEDIEPFDTGPPLKRSIVNLHEVRTRRYVSMLLCAPNMWEELHEHRALLHRLIDVAEDHPMTRIWVAIEHHGFTDVNGLIASFQDDEQFASYLAHQYDPRNANAMSDVNEALAQFINGVETFITTEQKDVERKTQLELLSQKNTDPNASN